MQNSRTFSMEERASREAQRRADYKYPIAWYQRSLWQQVLLIVIGISVSVYQLWVGWVNVPRWFTALGMVAFVGGWLVDVTTTATAFQLLPEYRKRGLVYPIAERNPYLRAYPSLREQLLSLSSLIKLATLLLVPLLPGLGWGGAWSGLSAAFNNRRNADAVRFQLKQYDLLVQDEEKRYPKVSRTRTGLTSMTGDHCNRLLFS